MSHTETDCGLDLACRLWCANPLFMKENDMDMNQSSAMYMTLDKVYVVFLDISLII